MFYKLIVNSNELSVTVMNRYWFCFRFIVVDVLNVYEFVSLKICKNLKKILKFNGRRAEQGILSNFIFDPL